MTTRQHIRLVFALVALMSLPIAGVASAQDWPARNVTVVVPLAAGSASDIMARVVMDQVGRQLGRHSSSRTALARAARSAAPTWSQRAARRHRSWPTARSAPRMRSIRSSRTTRAHRIHPGDPFRQAAGRGRLARQGHKTLLDLVAAGKAKPGALNYSSAGVGSASHFAAERLRISAGFTAQHLRSAAPPKL
jgi:hypothetical protein